MKPPLRRLFTRKRRPKQSSAALVAQAPRRGRQPRSQSRCCPGLTSEATRPRAEAAGSTLPARTAGARRPFAEGCCALRAALLSIRQAAKSQHCGAGESGQAVGERRRRRRGGPGGRGAAAAGREAGPAWRCGSDSVLLSGRSPARRWGKASPWAPAARAGEAAALRRRQETQSRRGAQRCSLDAPPSFPPPPPPSRPGV